MLYTANLIGGGHIIADIIEVPVTQFGGEQKLQRRSTVSEDRSWYNTEILKTVDYVPHSNTEVTNDISILSDPLMEKFTKAMAESLMIHVNLLNEVIWVGKKGVCLNFNLLGICSDPNCSYIHMKEK